MVDIERFESMREKLTGMLYCDNVMRTQYATDASAYREKPTAVTVAANKNDIKNAMIFARENNLSIIPRTAGTSLAGQVVGNGIVVYISKHFNGVI